MLAVRLVPAETSARSPFLCLVFRCVYGVLCFLVPGARMRGSWRTSAHNMSEPLFCFLLFWIVLTTDGDGSNNSKQRLSYTILRIYMYFLTASINIKHILQLSAAFGMVLVQCFFYCFMLLPMLGRKGFWERSSRMWQRGVVCQCVGSEWALTQSLLVDAQFFSELRDMWGILLHTRHTSSRC